MVEPLPVFAYHSSPISLARAIIYLSWVTCIGRMKQKVVISVQMEDAKKRAKAMKVAVGLPGVSSAAIEGTDMNRIVVIGEGVDSVTLTKLLRKRMGFAEIITVSEEKKEEKNPESTTVVEWPSVYPTQDYYATAHYQDPQCCCVM